MSEPPALPGRHPEFDSSANPRKPPTREPLKAHEIGGFRWTRYAKSNHTAWVCKYHIVWIPKYRRKGLYKGLREHLGEVLRSLARQKESVIEEGHLMPDHVHVLISIPPKYAVAKVVGFIKGKSAIHIARTYMGRRRNFSGQHFWARGYYVSTVGRDGAIFDPDSRDSNFGFRRGRSQHQAIRHVQQAVGEGHQWCASIDLASFFDEIPHGLILKLIRRKIADEPLVTLVARALKAGVVVDGQIEETSQGCPQGSPLSPMLSNIVLNELDHELERRGLKYCRWADDFVILVRSERAAHRVMAGCSRYLEEELGLRVNREKSRVAPVKGVEFLGFQLLRGKIRVSNGARKRFKTRVRELTRRNNPLSMFEVIEQLNTYLRGWVGYFRVQEFRYLFRDLDGWIRSRLRSTQLKKWKKPRKFQRIMIKAGFEPEEAHRVWIKMNRWQSVVRREVRFVMNLEWFRQRNLVFLHDFTQAAPGHGSGR